MVLLHSSELGSLVVDLNGKEEVAHVALEEADAELPKIAGNLSPRLIVRQERSRESSVRALNIDQLEAVERDVKQARGKGMRTRFPSDRQFRSVTSSHNSFQVLSHD